MLKWFGELQKKAYLCTVLLKKEHNVHSNLNGSKALLHEIDSTLACFGEIRSTIFMLSRGEY